VTDCHGSFTFCPPALLAGTTNFLYWLNELSLSAERFDVMNITNIVDMGDERYVGIGTAWYAECTGD